MVGSPFRYFRKRTKGPAFDLYGDLSHVPTPYLVACTGHSTKTEIARRCAEEIERRGEIVSLDNYSRVRALDALGQTCHLCHRKGIYRAGEYFFCSTHRQEAVILTKRFKATRDMRAAARGLLIEERMKARRSAERHHRARGKA